MHALVPFALCAISFVPDVAVAQTVSVPPVLISTLTHQHAVDPGGPITVTSDGVAFPCGGGACNGPGFAATLVPGGQMIVRFEAPAGNRFVMTHQIAGTQRLILDAHWTTGVNTLPGPQITPTITFENLTGTAPGQPVGNATISPDGEAFGVQLGFGISGDCSFTGMQIQFHISGAFSPMLRTYHAVTSIWNPSWGSDWVVNGASGADATLMSIQPAPPTPIPPVVISTLTHQHFTNSFPSPTTVTRDMVQFPCTGGACSGPGVTANIGQGDVVTLRFEPPSGSRFSVIHNAGGQTSFHSWAHWITATSDSISTSETPTISFEGLTGTPPTNTYALNSVADNGNAIVSENDFSVTGDFSFTAMQVQFTVTHALAHVWRTYGVVDSYSSPSWSCSWVVSGTSGADAPVMSIVTALATPFCFGDGTGAVCPCGNIGSAGRGCANSNPGSPGARLTLAGTPSIASDSVLLTCTDLTGPGLFFNASGVAATPVSFGDGLLCAAVGIVRMGVVFPTGSSASYPGGLTPNPVHIAGGVSGPGTSYVQCWYRDAVVFCSASNYNLSNGMQIFWAP